MLPASPRHHRKDLQDLRNLSRAPIWSFLQKHAKPRVPRSRAEAANPVRFPKLAGLVSSQVWKWLYEYARFRLGPKHRFLHYDGSGGDSGIYPLRGTDGDIRIALAGDWGTGTDEAWSVAQRIEAWKPHYAIHLGDVYYVGDPLEVAENFLGIANPRNQYQPCKWPGGSEGTFSLNGNHEMFARGYGYFDHILPALQQRASYFCLENDAWRVIALDTGYHSVGFPFVEKLFEPDSALPQEQMRWLRDVVKPRPDDPRGIVLLSHHQYYSAFDNCYAKPGRQLAEFFNRPVLWLWGHEHRMTIYGQASLPGGITAFGRCIGHGGMPIDLPPERLLHDFPVEFADARVYPNDERLRVGYNGFAKMTLRGNELTLDYVDLEDTPMFTEVWRSDGGRLVRVSAEKKIS